MNIDLNSLVYGEVNGENLARMNNDLTLVDQELNKDEVFAIVQNVLDDLSPDQAAYAYRAAQAFHQWKTLPDRWVSVSQAEIAPERAPSLEFFISVLSIPYQHGIIDEVDTMDLFKLKEYARASFCTMDKESALKLIKEVSYAQESFIPEMLQDLRDTFISLFGRTGKNGSKMAITNDWISTLVYPHTIDFFAAAAKEAHEQGEAAVERFERFYDNGPEAFIDRTEQAWFLIQELSNTFNNHTDVIVLLNEIGDLKNPPSWTTWKNYMNDETMRGMPAAWWSEMVN